MGIDGDIYSSLSGMQVLLSFEAKAFELGKICLY
jgi:hypothetical protein